MVPCELCKAIEDANTTSNEFWNTKLYENKSFIVLPSIGPLKEGQVIIASKLHTLNLLSMPAESKKDILPIITLAIKILGNNILFAEHGTFLNQNGGSCIEHTHLHVFPSYEHYFDILDDVLPILNSSFELVDLEKPTTVDFPYILTFDLRNNSRIYEAYNAHSQMIRKAICIKEGNEFGDWKKDKRIDLINRTISVWS